LADNIVSLMPPRCRTPNKPDPSDRGWLHYVEPYFGGGAVMLAMDPEGVSEVANDLNGDLTNFWRVLASENEFPKFVRIAQSIPFSKPEYDRAGFGNWTKNSAVNAAVKFFVRCRMSLAGRMDSFAPLSRNRTRRGMNEQASAWLSAVNGLPEVSARMKRVAIYGDPALDVIRREDGARTLYYLDPPYLDETRADPDVYQFEMTRADHEELLEVLLKTRGRFILSGYRSGLYDGAARSGNWQRVDFDMPNHAAGGESKRRMTECCWMNY
jgi:DNA adenine methylase